MVDIRKLLAVVAVTAASLLLGLLFLELVGPATAREVQAACAGLQETPGSPTLNHVSEGIIPAPDFKAQDYTGKMVSLSDYRGKVVLVNFWASWCTTCAAEKPSMEALQRELGDEDFVVLSLASDTDWEPIRKKFPQGSPLHILLDRADEGGIGPIASAYGVKAVPESFVVDKKGILRHYFVNKRNWNSDIAKTCLLALTDE